MLRFRKPKSDAVSGFLGSQTEFTGKLAFSGVVHLDGSFKGEIISRGTLVVGSDSVVHAQIHSNVLKIAGEVHGDLTATEKIELYPPAKPGQASMTGVSHSCFRKGLNLLQYLGRSFHNIHGECSPRTFAQPHFQIQHRGHIQQFNHG